MNRIRLARTAGAVVSALAVAAAGCAPIPATGPRLATGDGPGRSPGTGGGTELLAPPDWVTPRSELDWIPCADGGTRGIPADARVDCSLLGETPVLRLTTADTPDGSAPLVVVAGPGSPADELAIRFASAGTEITASHPIVIVDHKGRTGPAGTCLTPAARRTLDELADSDADPGSPELRGELAQTAQSCTDQLAGRELDFGATGAAEDLEELRQSWDVPGLAVLAVGAGARTALDYAGRHPGRVSLLILDSPAPWDGDQETAARSALDGSDAALRLWAASCTRTECGPGGADERVDTITRALDEARDPGARVPAALLSDVIRSALADLSGASAADASEGDVILGDIAASAPGTDDLPSSVRARAEALSSSSLRYVAECSDLPRRVPVNRVPELAAEWADDAPFGEILAAQLSACSTWPVPGQTVVELAGPAPVLLMSGLADPVAGAAALEPTAGMLSAAGAGDIRTLTWGAPGSRVVLHSACARSTVTEFLADPDSVERAVACPS
ncbi:alpha/beta hydrolase [Dietzia psychralcaliphila]|uniref:alpha/beta hydrolase n=1 Tax=Dietzia psychralcaliphila TaxID=139021 RepID=UPI0020A66999|nr:alpha/beta hydrolase [Dietzia psychralcaliphila]